MIAAVDEEDRINIISIIFDALTIMSINPFIKNIQSEEGYFLNYYNC